MLLTCGDWMTGQTQGTVDITNTTLSSSTVDESAICSITYNSNGTISVVADQAAPSNWLTSGGSTEFSIRLTTITGTLNVGVAGTWQTMGFNSLFSVQRTTEGSKTWTGTVEIRRDSDLSIVDTATLSLTATMTGSGGGGIGGGGGGGGGGGQNPPNEN